LNLANHPNSKLSGEKSEIRNPKFETMTKIQNQTKSKIKNQKSKCKMKKKNSKRILFAF